jgi:hypothetical protein
VEVVADIILVLALAENPVALAAVALVILEVVVLVEPQVLM